MVWAGSACLPRYGDVSQPGDVRVWSVIEGANLETSSTETGLLTMRLSAEFARLRPDVVLTIADRHETMATAIASSYQNIRLAHLLGGENSGNIDDRVRDSISMMADLHFPPTAAAAVRLEDMGVRGPVRAYGCPSIDLAKRASAHPYLGEAPIIVLQHAVTTEPDEAHAQLLATVWAVKSLGTKIPVVWLWPNEDAGTDDANRAIRSWANTSPAHVTFRRHIPAPEFLALLASARCIVGNSSVGVRESCYLGTPAVNIGTRQTGRETASNVIHAPHDPMAIAASIRAQLDHGRYPSSLLYGNGTAGERIAHDLVEVCR